MNGYGVRGTARLSRVMLVWCLWLAAHALAARGGSAQPPAEPPRKLALLIGIDRYKAVSSLTGCVNDVEAMREVLVGRFGFDPADIRVLRNEEATRQGILAALKTHLLDRVKAGDVVVFHYSGHGSRMPDTSGDELDGWDETIVPQDSRQGNVYDISDDELNLILLELGAKTPNVTFILDSCNSGTASRGGAVARRVRDDDRPPPPPKPGAPTARAAEGAADLRPAGAPYVLISACRADELANETAFEGHTHGALTWALVRSLMRDGEPTYRDVMDTVGLQVAAQFPSQHPQVEGTRLDARVFGVDEAPSQPYVLASPDGNQVALEAGEVLGLTVGSQLDVFPPATKSFADRAQAVATVEVVSAEPFQSKARVVHGGPVSPASRAVLVSRRFPGTFFRVLIEKPEGSPALKAIRGALDGLDFVKRVGSDGEAQIRVRQDGGRIVLEAPDLESLSPGVPVTDPMVTDRIVSQITQWAQWFNVLDLANPSSPLSVGLSLGGSGAGEGPREVADGEALTVSIENRSDRDLYLTVLDLNTTGEIAVLYPPPGAQEKLAARSKVTKSVEMFLPEGRKSVVDVFKVLATTSPIDPSIFAQGAIRKVDAAAPADPLADFLKRSVKGRSRNSRPAVAGAWTAAAQTVRVRKRDQRGDAFILHYGGERGDTLSLARGALAECGGPAPGAECWRLSPFGSDGTSVLAQAGGKRALETQPRSLGSVWDEAYELRKTSGASRVEPVVEWEDNEAAGEPVSGARDVLFDVPDKDGAKSNNRWSLQHVRADAAWELLQRKGHASGEEASGVLVAHPDTGYRDHAEIWTADEARSPVLWKHGYNYVDQTDDARDPLDTSGLLPNPGHGTKSSSVIVSSKGKQWSGGAATDFVDGVAPGAHTLPLRVHRSVVQFNPSRLAMAIYDAASDDRTRVKSAPALVSVSMGGLPSWSLWKAVRYAEQRGVLVLAAAGNKVGFVVWPARFKATIAVAATNVECTPWRGSSHGDAVDISAPGESVWMADVAKDGTYSIGRGQGTTYATATTAGVAALWTSYHRGEAAFEQLRASGRLTEAFRQVLQTTAWRPDGAASQVPPGVHCKAGASWDARQYGPGIVDAAKALAAPLPAVAAPRALEGAGLSDLPLFASLFAAGTPKEVPRARYAKLWGAGADRFEDVAGFEAEIMTWYASDADVRAAVDPLTVDGDPGAPVYRRLGEVLQAKGISASLRAALRAANGGS